MSRAERRAPTPSASADREVVIARVIDAPYELVFDALSGLRVPPVAIECLDPTLKAQVPEQRRAVRALDELRRSISCSRWCSRS